ncbi:MAG: O-acetyl-ADP-ribose deacetylase [Chloroflexota bacterium]
MMKSEHALSRVKVNQTTIELVQGDITQESTDTIVNAANASLMGGGGVDGAIHRAAGPELLQETRQLGGCETGNAKISKGYRLKARHVIHAVGPVYRRNDTSVPKLLASAYQRSLELASENDLRSISFSAISTGIYGYPMEEAAEIALDTIISYAEAHEDITLVRMVLFTEDALAIFREVLGQLASNRSAVEPAE